MHIIKFIFKYSLFPFNVKVRCYKIMVGRKPSSTPIAAKLLHFINLAEFVSKGDSSTFPYTFTWALVLQIKRGQICWKANISGYIFYVEMFPKFCHFGARISSRAGVMNLPKFHRRFFLSEFSAKLPSVFLLRYLFSMFSYILWFLPCRNH